MPIADSASVAVLTSLSAGVWTMLSAVPTPQEHGFDHLDVEWVCDFRGTAKTALEVAAAFPLGARFGTDDFWLRSGVPDRLGGNVWRFKAHYEGRISAEKPSSIRIQATQEVIAVDSLTFGDIDALPANVREANPTVQIGYVLIDAAPPTASVGLFGAPEVAPAAREGGWGALVGSRRINTPSGWVLGDIDADSIAGSEPQAHWVSENWQYIQEYVPL